MACPKDNLTPAIAVIAAEVLTVAPDIGVVPANIASQRVERALIASQVGGVPRSRTLPPAPDVLIQARTIARDVGLEIIDASVIRPHVAVVSADVPPVVIDIPRIRGGKCACAHR